MLYFVLVWVVLLGTSYAIGSGFARYSQLSFMRFGDRVFLQVWVGLVLLAVLFLTIALALPLSLSLGLSICLIISTLIILTSAQVREEILAIKTFLQHHFFLTSVMLLVSTGAIVFVTQPVQWIESEFYHYQASRWLLEEGAVKGLVLLLKNLGIVSSWFAFIAPWNGNIINFRAGAVVNGFIIFIAVIHLIFTLYRIRCNHAKSSDWFISFFCFLLLAYTLISQEFQLIIVSLSPDLPIVFLIGIFSWSLLILSERETVHQESFAIFPSTSIPLIVALGAVAIKLSAFPLFAIALLYYFWHNRQHLSSLLVGGTITVLLLAPVMAVGYQTSGCLFYPASALCFNVPWALPLAETQAFEGETTSLERWYGTPPSDQIAFIWLFKQWFNNRPLNRLMTYLIVLSFGGAAITLKMNRFKVNLTQIWVILVGISGIVFTLAFGALIRFALGYLLVLPSVTLLTLFQPYGNKISQIGENLGVNFNSPRSLWLSLGLMISLVLSYPNLHQQWLIPPAPPQPFLVAKEAKNFTYFVSISDNCWASKLPCNSNDSAWSNIQLRKPEKGLAGGFSSGNLNTP